MAAIKCSWCKCFEEKLIRALPLSAQQQRGCEFCNGVSIEKYTVTVRAVNGEAELLRTVGGYSDLHDAIAADRAAMLTLQQGEQTEITAVVDGSECRIGGVSWYDSQFDRAKAANPQLTHRQWDAYIDEIVDNGGN